MFDIRDDGAEQTIVLTSNRVRRTDVAVDVRRVNRYIRIVLMCAALPCSVLSHAALADAAAEAATTPAAASTKLLTAASSAPRSAAKQTDATPAASTSKGHDLASQVGSYGDLSADAPCH